MILQEIVFHEAPSGSGYAYAARFPKHDDARKAFKQAVESYRWDPDGKMWLFRRKDLPAARAWAEQAAVDQKWIVHDFLLLTGKERMQALEAFLEERRKRLTATYMKLLEKMLCHKLTLLYWTPQSMVFETTGFTSSFRLYDPMLRLMDNHTKLLDTVTRVIPYSESTDRFVIPFPSAGANTGENELIALLTFNPVMFGTLIKHLKPGMFLSRVQSFENNIGHWHDENKNLWFGAPVTDMLEAGCLLPGQDYTIWRDPGEDVQYLIAQAEYWFDSYIKTKRPIRAWEIIGIHPEETDTLFPFLRQYHLEQCFSDWAHALIASKECALPKNMSWSHTRWQSPYFWQHPARHLLQYIKTTYSAELMVELGWQDEDLRHFDEQIHQLQQEAASQFLQDLRENALMYAAQLLQTKAKWQLEDLADKMQVTLRKSWTKERMIQELLAQGEASKELAYKELELSPEPVNTPISS